MKRLFLFLIVLVLFIIDACLACLLWLPVRLIYGVNTFRFALESEYLAPWLYEKLNNNTNE